MIWIAAILMDAETEGDDGIEGLQFLPPLPKRRRSTCFDNCIICQSDSKENLRKGKQSSVKNFISKLQVRQDDVYERLSPNFDVLYKKRSSMQHIQVNKILSMRQSINHRWCKKQI